MKIIAAIGLMALKVLMVIEGHVIVRDQFVPKRGSCRSFEHVVDGDGHAVKRILKQFLVK